MKFKFFQQLFVKTSLLLRHSYSLARGCLFFLAAASFLSVVLTACAGGGSGGSGGNGGNVRLSPLEVNLTFAPIEGGFRIGNQSDFGNMVSLNITATSGGGRIEDANINISRQFIGSGYDFTGLDDQSNYTFRIIGTLDDGRQQEVKIVFTWEENEEDHERLGGIWPGLNTDGDGRADSVDEDDDNDNVTDGDDNCRLIANGDQLNTDKDTLGDSCDGDDDNDGLDDVDEPTGCELNSDCDNDGLDDGDEVAGCVQEPDCDRDTIGDEEDACPVGVMSWTSSASNDKDSDGCRDDIEDIDDDGDGLIEIATHEELNAVRYALNGNGSRSAANAALKTDGCGGGQDDDGMDITTCSGYELVDNISLAAYSSGDGWQPLGHDTDGSRNGCQGAAFNGAFEGNGRTISNLNINRSGEDCVGLFGYVAEGSEIRNLALRDATVIGANEVGGLVGFGRGARIVSSSVVMNEIKGNSVVGGLMGNGESAWIHSSSVSVAGVIGVGSREALGGLVGQGTSAQIVSSSVVAGEVSGVFFVGGLTGNGASAQIYSSWVVVGELSSTTDAGGGLVGNGASTQIYSSSVVAGEISGANALGGLAGVFGSDSRVAYSYVISGSNTKMLVGAGSGQGAASYWDSETSKVSSGNHGTPQTTSALRTPDDYEGIYDTWDDDTDIFGDGAIDEPLAVWCDRDKSGSIEEDEKINDNLIWDFGGSDEYPAIRCTPIDPDEWRGLWSVDGDGKLSFLGFLGG